MKKLFVILTLLCAYTNLSAMEQNNVIPVNLESRVKLPSPIDLFVRLRNHEYHELCTGTELTAVLGNQEIPLSLFVQRINFILTDYCKKNQVAADYHKSPVIKIILQDQPEALQILRQYGYIQ